MNGWDNREVRFCTRIEDRNVLSIVVEVCSERIFWFLGFEIGIKVFLGIEEDIRRGNSYKNKEGTDSDDNGKKSTDIEQHQDCLMCIEVGRKNTFLGSVSLLTI
jgi:hypothetical protein